MPSDLKKLPPIVVWQRIVYAVAKVGGVDIKDYPGDLDTDPAPVMIGNLELHRVLGPK